MSEYTAKNVVLKDLDGNYLIPYTGAIKSINGNAPDSNGAFTPEQTGCLPLAGGTMTGPITFGTTALASPSDGALTFGGKNLVRSVNGLAADAAGNVSVTTITGNAGTATTLKTARTIDGVSFNGSANITHYGECSTAAATQEKAVSCTGFTLAAGARITVKFTVTNTAASPTLNVNSTGAKPVYYRGSAITAGALAANRTYTFLYDGTSYNLVGDIDTTNTRVGQYVTTTDAEYPLMAAYTAGINANKTEYLRFASGVTLNPSTGTITAQKFVGTMEGSAGTAEKLSVARSFLTHLDSAEAASFDGSADADIGITGILAIANGGTGASTAADALANLGAAPVAHAASATTYGAGTASNYGHVKLSDATNSTSAASAGIAASPKAVKAAYDLANTANTAAGSATTLANGAIKALSVSGKTITYTKNDGTTGTITTQDTNTDTKVTQTVSTTNADYPLLACATANASASTTGTSVFASGVVVNPSINSISATKLFLSDILDTNVITMKSSSVTMGTNPSTTIHQAIHWSDVTGETGAANRMATIEHSVDTSGTAKLTMGPYQFIANKTSYTGALLNLQMTAAGAASASFNGTLTATSVYNAVWNDYAEWFARAEMEDGTFVETAPGDIIALDTEASARTGKDVYRRAIEGDTCIAGIHSDTFGHIVGGTLDPAGLDDNAWNIKTNIPVGLAGRVWCRMENADALTAADIGKRVVPSKISGLGRLMKEGDSVQTSVGFITRLPDAEHEGRALIKICAA